MNFGPEIKQYFGPILGQSLMDHYLASMADKLSLRWAKIESILRPSSKGQQQQHSLMLKRGIN
jgi:hypothetical protein